MSLFWKQNGCHITSLMPNRSFIISKRPYISHIIKRPARDACLCMGELPAPPAPAAPPAPPAPHFIFLITL